MSGWDRCNKISGVHWPRVPPQELTFKVTIKRIGGIVPLPKFEDYVSSNDSSGQLDAKTEEYAFKWQEKVFSRWEVHQYEDVHNCTTEQQRKYNEEIKNTVQDRNKLFTYVNVDNYETEALTTSRASFDEMGSLGSCLACLQLEGEEKVTGVVEPSLRSLGCKSMCKKALEEEEWIAMHIMMDGSEQDGDIEIIIKREAVLLSVYWSPSSGCLVLRPDVNSMEWNPYTPETGGVRWDYHYAVELCRETQDQRTVEARTQLVQLVRRLRRKWERRHRQLLDMALPPAATTRYYCTLEILSAELFDDNNLFIEYEVRVPPECKCSERVQGRTHTAALQGSTANYSHLVEFELDYEDNAAGACRKEPRLYVEVISLDWWERERTQGAAACPLPLRPGARTLLLPCLRPVQRDHHADSRRFFLGGARLLDDVSWLGVPDGHQGKTLNKFGIKCVTAGAVKMRVSVVSQRLGGGAGGGGGAAGGSGERASAGALLRSVNTVLMEYQRARERLAECRQDLTLPVDDAAAS